MAAVVHLAFLAALSLASEKGAFEVPFPFVSLAALAEFVACLRITGDFLVSHSVCEIYSNA
jgi:hypothetical protein